MFTTIAKSSTTTLVDVFHAKLFTSTYLVNSTKPTTTFVASCELATIATTSSPIAN
jgi:hypothetical protein